MESFDELLFDLHQAIVNSNEVPQQPYLDTDITKEKFQSILKNLQRSIRLKSRTTSLINAYYLGKLLTNEDFPENFKFKKNIPDHYERIARNTFDVFEFCPNALVRNNLFTTQVIRKLKRNEITRLREIVIFAGAQNSGEEVVNM